MMDMYSKNQYLKALIEERGYRLKSKKEKSQLLNEYCKTTEQNRNYVIRKIRTGICFRPNFGKRKRRLIYDGYVKDTLVQIWKIFDESCGQRLKPLIETELERLRKLGELNCSDETALKLKKISSATIDRKLAHQKEIERIKRKYQKKVHPLLYQKIPVKLSDEWDRSQLGNIQTDLIEHCGQSARGEYINTVSNTDIATGWWEGEAIMGRGQIPTQEGLDKAKSRFPFSWKEIHSDNGTEYINAHLFRYTQKEKIGFSRSRPYKKNDNCFVEQKNWTHVKKFVGWARYDTKKEQQLLNDLYRNELHLYKNFFQSVMKLKEKVRVGSKIHRKYHRARTPYRRVMESKEVSEEKKRQLKKIYDSLNPAELKRTIDKKLDLLYKIYQKKNKSEKIEPQKRLKPGLRTFLNVQPEFVSVS